MNDKIARRLTPLFCCLVLLSVFLSTFLSAQTSGQIISGVAPQTLRANQSKVFWHDGYWWGLFVKTGIGDNRYIYKYENGAWTESFKYDNNFGEESYVDGYIDSEVDSLYIVDTRRSRFWSLGYNSSTETWSSGVGPISVTTATSNDLAGCITKSNSGRLFIFTSESSTLKGRYSDDNGESWELFDIRSGLNNSGMTDAVAFNYSNNDYVGVILGENSNTPEFRFFKLRDGDDPTEPFEWAEETLNYNYPTNTGDNHVSLIKDFDQNLYMVGKYGSGPSGVVFALFKRSSTNGSWSIYDVSASGGTRPALSIDETNDKLYVFATVSDKIQYATLNSGSLANIGTGDWTPILQNGSSTFNDLSVSYQQLTSASDAMVIGTSGSNVWYNTIALDFDAPDPLIISEVNSTSPIEASYVEIYNTSGSVVDLTNYSVRYYNNNGTPVIQDLSGSVPAYGYVVIARNTSAYNLVYGSSPNYSNSSFLFDGERDGIALVKDVSANLEKTGMDKTTAETIIDYFNYAGGEMESWSAGQLFERTRWPNDGSNIYLDYDRSRTTSAGSPGGTNDTSLPVLLSSFAATVENNRVNLQWATSAELDNFEWVIERRMNTDENFHEIGRMAGNGTTNERHEYDYLDAAVLEGNAYEYRLSNVDYSGQINQYPQIVRVNITAGSIEDFQLYANYPNPFNGETNIRFRIGEPTKTTLVVYDITGRVVKTIFSGELNQGEHIYRWDATDNVGNPVASGFYLVRLRTDKFYKSIKMILAQ